ncbi:MAG: hypothetical protein IKF49_07415, partial [Clostridia bacterium]|nr:hypothetical protein [Clostridia bacterium]
FSATDPDDKPYSLTLRRSEPTALGQWVQNYSLTVSTSSTPTIDIEPENDAPKMERRMIQDTDQSKRSG